MAETVDYSQLEPDSRDWYRALITHDNREKYPFAFTDEAKEILGLWKSGRIEANYFGLAITNRMLVERERAREKIPLLQKPYFFGFFAPDKNFFGAGVWKMPFNKFGVKDISFLERLMLEKNRWIDEQFPSDADKEKMLTALDLTIGDLSHGVDREIRCNTITGGYNLFEGAAGIMVSRSIRGRQFLEREMPRELDYLDKSARGFELKDHIRELEALNFAPVLSFMAFVQHLRRVRPELKTVVMGYGGLNPINGL